MSTRILRGEGISAADHIEVFNARRSFIARTEQRVAPYDALLLPTTANVPPAIADLADDTAFTLQNLRVLRNCTLINVLDGCADLLSAHRDSEVPVGLMLAAAGGSGRRILELASLIKPSPSTDIASVTG
jgi:aspartyl-tRNA(Asn)/glutamyl-tRNA(Gln) amidotransferase subunit A